MKLTDIMQRIIKIHIMRGQEAREDVKALSESLWSLYDWNLTDNCADNQVAIEALGLFQALVLEQEDEEIASEKARLLLALLVSDETPEPNEALRGLMKQREQP